MYGVNEYRYPGADMGVLLVRDRMQTAERSLMPKAGEWARAITSQFSGLAAAVEVVQPDAILYGKWL